MIRPYILRALRIEVAAPLEFSCGDKVYRGHSVDLSDGGIRSRIGGFLSVGDQGRIVLYAPDGTWERNAEVVYSSLGDVRFRFMPKARPTPAASLALVPFDYIQAERT